MRDIDPTEMTPEQWADDLIYDEGRPEAIRVVTEYLNLSDTLGTQRPARFWEETLRVLREERDDSDVGYPHSKQEA